MKADELQKILDEDGRKSCAELCLGDFVETVKCYVVYGNTDDIEGKGQRVYLGQFDDRLKAYAFAKGKGPMGSHAEVVLEEVVILKGYDHLPLFTVELSAIRQWDSAEERKRNLIASARAKLTPEEMRALGLR